MHIQNEGGSVQIHKAYRITDYFSLGANFPEFPKRPCNSEKFMLGYLYSWIVGCKRILYSPSSTSILPQLPIIGIY